jgi:peptidoglycan/LPS O-acetylase OafA/YrhL
MMRNGWVGVDLFFVLSGFLITGILLDTRHRSAGHYLKGFYARRVLRIFPLYYGFLAALFIALPALQGIIGASNAEALRSGQVWLWTYSVNVLAAISGSWQSTPLVGHFWSLSVEEHFYLAWPLVVFWTNLRKLRLVCIALIIGAPVIRLAMFAALRDGFAGNVLTFTRADTLAIGALLAISARSEGGLSRLRNIAPFALAASAVTLMAMLAIRRPLQGIDWHVQALGFTVIGILFASALVMLIHRPVPIADRLMTLGPLTALGTYSYALYVFHQPVQQILHGLGLHIPRLSELGGSTMAGTVLFILLAGTATLALAVISWNLLEKPMLSLKRYFPR